MKRCRDCAQDKPLEDFSPATKSSDGRTSYCRACLRLRHQRYRDARNGGVPARRSAARASSPDLKWCPACRRELQRDDFGRNRTSRDGLTS